MVFDNYCCLLLLSFMYLPIHNILFLQRINQKQNLITSNDFQQNINIFGSLLKDNFRNKLPSVKQISRLQGIKGSILQGIEGNYLNSNQVSQIAIVMRQNDVSQLDESLGSVQSSLTGEYDCQQQDASSLEVELQCSIQKAILKQSRHLALQSNNNPIRTNQLNNQQETVKTTLKEMKPTKLTASQHKTSPLFHRAQVNCTPHILNGCVTDKSNSHQIKKKRNTAINPTHLDNNHKLGVQSSKISQQINDIDYYKTQQQDQTKNKAHQIVWGYKNQYIYSQIPSPINSTTQDRAYTATQQLLDLAEQQERWGLQDHKQSSSVPSNGDSRRISRHMAHYHNGMYKNSGLNIGKTNHIVYGGTDNQRLGINGNSRLQNLNHLTLSHSTNTISWPATIQSDRPRSKSVIGQKRVYNENTTIDTNNIGSNNKHNNLMGRVRTAEYGHNVRGHNGNNNNGNNNLGTLLTPFTSYYNSSLPIYIQSGNINYRHLLVDNIASGHNNHGQSNNNNINNHLNPTHTTISHYNIPPEQLRQCIRRKYRDKKKQKDTANLIASNQHTERGMNHLNDQQCIINNNNPKQSEDNQHNCIMNSNTYTDPLQTIKITQKSTSRLANTTKPSTNINVLTQRSYSQPPVTATLVNNLKTLTESHTNSQKSSLKGDHRANSNSLIGKVGKEIGQRENNMFVRAKLGNNNCVIKLAQLLA